MAAPSVPPLLVLYDGSCGLCDRLVQFLLRHERGDGLRFAALQGELAAAVLARHGRPTGRPDPDALGAIEGFETPNEVALFGAPAAVRALRHGGPLLRALARILEALPPPLTAWAYRQVAKHRFRLFGRRDACALPRAEQRHKFL